MTRIKTLLPYLVLTALAVVVRIPFFEVPMISDEGGYAYVAHFWSDAYMPYRDIPFDRPQGIFLIYRFALALGEDIGSIRLFAALWNALTVAACMLGIRALFGGDRTRGGIWIGGGLMAVFSTAPSIEGFTANAEIFTLLPLTIAALFTWRRRWLWAGLAAGAATAIKPIGVSGLLLGVAWLFATKARKRDGGLLLAGFAVAPAACLLHGALLDWGAYWSSFVDRRLLLFSAASMSAGEQFGLLSKGIGDTVSAWAAPAIAALYTIIRLRDRAAAFVGLWILSSLAGMAMGGLWHWHYFQQLLPPLAVGAGGCLVAWGRGDRSIRKHATDAVWAAGLIIAAVAFVRTDVPYWSREPLDVSWDLYRRPAYVMTEEIGRFVRDNTGPDDPFYVAFAEAELYYAARRKAAVPQLYFRDVEYSEEIFQQAIACVSAAEPAVIVMAQAPPPERMERGRFIALLERNYEIAAQSGSLSIWIRRR